MRPAKPGTKSAKSILTAILSLPRRERQSVLRGLVKKGTLRRELIYLAGIEESRTDPSRMFHKYSKARQKKLRDNPEERVKAVGRALRRAAKVARKEARMHGTPIWIEENGKIRAIKP